MKTILLSLIAAVIVLALPVREAVCLEPRWTELEDGTEVPVPPAEHPRLYLMSGDIPGLIGRMEHPVLEPYWESLQELAGENIQAELMVGALRYLTSGNREQGRRTVELALATISMAEWEERMDISRQIGRMMVSGAVVYDWCYDLLTEREKEEFVVQFIRLAEQFEIGYPIRRPGSLTGHIGEWMIMRDLLSAGVAVFDEYPDMYYEAAGKFFRDVLESRNWLYEGHAYHQGIAYGDTRYGAELYPLWIYDRMGFGNVYDPSQQFVPYHWLYMRRPDGRLMTTGDDFIWKPVMSALLSSSYYGDRYVLADYLSDPWHFEYYKHATFPTDQLYLLLWQDPELRPGDISELPLTRYMGTPYGWMVARTGWGAESVICEMKVNEYNYGNHQHLDAGAFQIYYRGPLAVDTGIYEGTDGGYVGPHNVNYYKRTIAHNSLLVFDPQEKFVTRGFRQIEKVNDGGQRMPNLWVSAGYQEELFEDGYRTGEARARWFGPDGHTPLYSYLKGDITGAYTRKVESVVRSFVFMNLGGGDVPAALAVFDRVVSRDPSFTKYWLLHSMEEPAVKGNTVDITLTQRGWSGRLVNTTLLPEASNARFEKVGGPGHEFDVFGRNFASGVRPGRDPEDYELGAWRVQLSPLRESAEDLFLNVMQVTGAGSGEVTEVERILSEKMAGFRLADRAVLFSRNAGETGLPVSFRLPEAEGELAVLVCDLASGAWQVLCDGRVIHPGLTVDPGVGTLFFRGPAGSYELRR